MLWNGTEISEGCKIGIELGLVVWKLGMGFATHIFVVGCLHPQLV